MKAKIISILIVLFAYIVITLATPCTDALQRSLKDTSLISGIIMNTGKGFNDLGDYEGCENVNGLVYVSLRIQVKQNAAYLGICMPIECSKEDFSVVTDAIKKFINNPEAIVTISIPSETIQKVSTGHIIGFLFFALYLTIVFIGVITEYTTLFNKPNVIHEEHVEKQKTKLGLVFLSFSLTRNVRKIFWGKPAYDDNHLIIFNGIRVLSLMYLICGQGYISVLQSPLSDLDATDRILQRWPFYMVVGALFAVDVFFLISGFLAAHVLLNKFFQTACFNIPMIFFHRIYRLVLPIGMIILFVVTFLYFLGDGPIWKAEMQQIIDPCYKKWWEDIFFLCNMIPAPDQSKCLRWLWYISSDMQAFLFVPFQIMAYRRHRYIGYGVTYFLLFGTVLGSFLISATGHLSINPIADPNYFQGLFVRPWARIGAYEVGVLFGMFYFEWMNKNQSQIFSNSFGTQIFNKVYNSRITRYLFYGIGFFIINLIMFLQYLEGRSLRDPKQHFGQFFHNLFNGVSRPLFAFCLIMILMGPLTGRHKLLRWALGGSGYTPWSRVSFMGYIIHVIVIKMFYAQMRQANYAMNKTIIFINCAMIFLIFILAVPFSALFESPFMQLKKLVFFPEKQKEDVDNSIDTKESSYISEQKETINS